MAPPAPLTARHLGRATLARRGLLEPINAPAAEAVAGLGSVQAQHPELAARRPRRPRREPAERGLLLSHGPRHRQRVIVDEHRSSVSSKNADVLPTFLLDGAVPGMWELSRSEGRAAITLRPFGQVGRRDGDALVAEAERVLGLLEPDAERSVELAPRRS